MIAVESVGCWSATIAGVVRDGVIESEETVRGDFVGERGTLTCLLVGSSRRRN